MIVPYTGSTLTHPSVSGWVVATGLADYGRIAYYRRLWNAEDPSSR
jgi:hypothetical protein